MKTLLKIIVALVVLTGAFNASRYQLNNYQFEDALHEALLFDPYANDAKIIDTAMKLAKEYQIPLAAENITVKERGSDIIVEMSYTETINLLPGVYSREWTFTPSSSTRLLVGKRSR